MCQIVKAMIFPVVMQRYHKESWAPKNWCFWIVVLEKTLESLLDFKEIQPINPKGNQSWNSTTLATWCEELTHWKDPGAGNDWRWKEKGMTEDEMVGCHHQLDGHEFEQAPWVGEGREAWRAAVHGVWKSWTWLPEQVNWTKLIYYSFFLFFPLNIFVSFIFMALFPTLL